MELIFWIIVLLITIITEIITTSALISIWFSLGSLFSILSYYLGFSFHVQVPVFIVSSTLFILFLRPFATKVIKSNHVATNADRLIGTKTRLLEDINLDKLGLVKVNGIEWNVISEDNTIIQKDSIVKIVKIEGSKLVVEKTI